MTVATLPTATSAFDLEFLSYADAAPSLTRTRDVLGVVAFGSRRPPLALPQDCPFVHVSMPLIGGDGFCEIWRSSEPVASVQAGEVRAAHSDGFCFGSIEVPGGENLEHASRHVYEQIFDAMDELGFPHLLRAWNYLPAINGELRGLERYRHFNIGRYEAFAARNRIDASQMPAACALGTREGPLAVYFLAGRRPGRPIENPRQVSAFRYPQEYGPRSPTFARAMLIPSADSSVLSISGTASVVGHRTLHAGDPAAQIAESITNVRTLVDAAREAEPAAAVARALYLKAYLRDPDDLPVVRASLETAFGAAHTVYLRADICRSDLLVEIEGMRF